MLRSKLIRLTPSILESNLALLEEKKKHCKFPQNLESIMAIGALLEIVEQGLLSVVNADDYIVKIELINRVSTVKVRASMSQVSTAAKVYKGAMMDAFEALSAFDTPAAGRKKASAILHEPRINYNKAMADFRSEMRAIQQLDPTVVRKKRINAVRTSSNILKRIAAVQKELKEIERDWRDFSALPVTSDTNRNQAAINRRLQ